MIAIRHHHTEKMMETKIHTYHEGERVGWEKNSRSYSLAVKNVQNDLTFKAERLACFTHEDHTNGASCLPSMED